MILISVCDALKITNLRVPATYVLEHNSRNPAPLILDCEYELDENEEKGFVLKWFLGEQAVYQWIPSKKPFPFVSIPLCIRLFLIPLLTRFLWFVNLCRIRSNKEWIQIMLYQQSIYTNTERWQL